MKSSGCLVVVVVVVVGFSDLLVCVTLVVAACETKKERN
jgi:hypothetical protein